jgi:hypothetical protein
MTVSFKKMAVQPICTYATDHVRSVPVGIYPCDIDYYPVSFFPIIGYIWLEWGKFDKK